MDIGGITVPIKKHKYKLNKKFDFWSQEHKKNLEWIKNEFVGKDGLRFLEIGVFEGRTAVWLLDNVLTGKNCHYTGVEPDILPNLMHNIEPHLDRFHIIDGCSFYSIPRYSEEYDFIIIDGDHNAKSVLEDIIISWRVLKEGGIMLIDDYEMELKDPWFYVSHKEFITYPRVNFTHPRFAIDSFLTIYRGLYEKVIDNVQIGVRKICDLREKNTDGKDVEKLGIFTYKDKR